MLSNSKDIALTAARAALEKKADDVKILDMKDFTAETDYFVICSASTSTQTNAITQEILGEMEEAGVELARREGHGGNSWILLDYRNVVVHVFMQEDRQFYGLEKLWGDAKQVAVDPQ